MKVKVKYLNETEKVYDNIESIIERGSRLMMFEYNALLDEYIVLKPKFVESIEIIAGKEV